jgi:hypothetical protein
MRMLIALAVAASLTVACTRQGDNDIGRPPPETGRVTPPDSSMNAPPPAGARPDSGMVPRTPPDTAHKMHHDSM